MKVLHLAICFSIFWFEASCLESQYVTKDDLTSLESEVRTIASTLNAFMEEMREQLITVNQRTEQQTTEFALETDEPSLVLNDTTIEERVTILEFQMESLTTEVTDLTMEVTDQGNEIDVIDGEIATIFTGQAQQDERILELEGESEGFEDSITNLESTASALDNRLTLVNYTLSEETQELDSRVTLVEDLVSQLDGRISQLEIPGTVAFQADFDSYTSIPIASVVVFDIVALNIGDGYNSATGEFTVPSGGAGLYFFYVNFFAQNQKAVNFSIRVNEEALCSAYADMNSSGADDNGTPSCGAVAVLAEGDVVDVFYVSGTDDTPVDSNTLKYNSFTGFRIAPE